MSHTITDMRAARFNSIAVINVGDRSGSGVVNLVRSAFARVLVWRQRALDRRHLAAMDGRMRKDLGLSNVEIWHEINKPFWLG
jgi:uncharacterized protein YjiS (DUF1127 family)